MHVLTLHDIESVSGGLTDPQYLYFTGAIGPVISNFVLASFYNGQPPETFGYKFALQPVVALLSSVVFTEIGNQVISYIRDNNAQSEVKSS